MDGFMDAKTRAEVALADLAALESASAIALHLAQRCHTGRRGSVTRCPLAHYVRAHLPVGHPVVLRHELYFTANDHQVICYMPPSLARFMRNFDQGKYLYLVDTTGRPSTSTRLVRAGLQLLRDRLIATVAAMFVVNPRWAASTPSDEGAEAPPGNEARTPMSAAVDELEEILHR